MKTKSVDKLLPHDGGFESVEHRLRAAQIWQLYSQSRVGLIGALLGALILVATLWHVVSHLVLVVWLVSYALIQVARHALISAFHRTDPSGDATFRWGLWFAVGTFLSALLWGLAGVLLYLANFPLHQFVLSIFLAGITSAAAVVYSPTTECYLPTILVAMLPLAARHIYDWDEAHLITGGVIVLFSIVLALTASRMHGFVVGSLRLRFEKDKLVESLQEARGDLEMRVEERSAELKRTNENLVAEIAERVRAEKALRESEEKYRSLAELLPQFVYEVDEKGFFTFVNRSALESTGYTQEDVDKGLNALDVFIPEETERLADNISRSLGGEKTPGTEYTLLRKDGATMSILVYARPIVHDEKIVGLRGVGVDISDRKLAEDSLRESEQKYRSVVENMQDVFYRTDMQGTITMVSPSGPEMIGYESVDQIIGLNVARDFYKNPDERDRMLALLQQKGKVSSFEVELVRRDGDSIIVSTNSHVYYDKSGQPLGVEGVFSNVTERRRAEKALRDSEEKYRRIVENTQEVIYQTDMDGRLIFLSPSSERLLGYTPDESLGRRLTGLYAFPEERTRFLNLLMENGSVTDFEAELSRKDGSRVWVSTNARLLRDEKGNPIGVEGVGRDVTDRKKAEKDLHGSRKMLQIVLDTIPAGVSWKDRDSVYQGANRAWLEGAGLNSSQEVVGMTDYDLPWGKDEANSYREHDRRVMESGIPEYDIIEPYTRADGALAWAKTSKAPLRDLEGNVVGILGTYEDITDRKQAQEALRESEERYRSLFEAAGDGIFVLETEEDHRSRILSANLAAAEMHGYTLDELLTLRMFDLETSECTKALEPKRNERFLSGEVIKEDVTHRKKDGTLFYVETTARMLKLGDRTCILAIDRDITRRKYAEDALQESEEKYRSVVENMQDVFYRMDMEGNITLVSPSGAQMMGYESVDEMIGLNVPKIFYKNPEDRDRLLAILRESERVSNYELEFVRKDGKSIMVSSNSHIYRDKSGKPLGTEGVLTDITERKRAEDALRESEEKYRILVETAHEGIYVAQDGMLNFVNPALAEIYEQSQEELLSRPFSEFIHPDDREMVLDRSLRRARGEEVQRRYAHRLLTEDGRTKWLEIDSAAISWEGKPAVLVFTSDITERMQTEESLRQSEEKYRTLFQDSVDAVFMIMADGTLIDANQAYFDLFGYEKEEILGQSVLKTYADPADRPGYSEALLAKGFVKDYPLRMVRKDGRQLDCLLSSRIERDRHGNILAYRGFIRDTTEQKNLQTQLVQAQKMEAIGTLAGGIAHDFNNLLTVVMGFSELLLAERDEKHPEYEDLQKIFRAAKNGAELVQRLLMFSRKSEPKPVPMNLNKQIVQVEKLLRRTIPRMVDIKLELSADLPQINADASQVEQVIMNLAVNARDAIPDKGNLTVKTEVLTLDEEYCRSHIEASPGDYVLLEVLDTGQGMDKETVEHIFEPFFTTKEVGRGTGLGLAMVYGIVKLHHGHITVHSEVGKGTSFKVYLPAIPVEAESEIEESGAIPVFGTETVLLVDDEQFVRELGARILTKHGYTVLQAVNGKEALDLFKRERSRISLVILDLIMPELSGTECLKELLKIDPQVNVLVASGFSAETSVKETVKIGAKGFVTKPFRVKEFLRDVRRILDRD